MEKWMVGSHEWTQLCFTPHFCSFWRCKDVFGATHRFTFKLLLLVCNENYFGLTCGRLSWSLKQFVVVYGRLLEHEDHEESFKIPKQQIAYFCALVCVFTLRGESEVLAHWCQKQTFNYVKKSLQSLSLWSMDLNRVAVELTHRDLNVNTGREAHLLSAAQLILLHREWLQNASYPSSCAAAILWIAWANMNFGKIVDFCFHLCNFFLSNSLFIIMFSNYSNFIQITLFFFFCFINERTGKEIGKKINLQNTHFFYPEFQSLFFSHFLFS